MKNENPAESLGALQQLTIAKIGELKAQRQQEEQLQLEEQQRREEESGTSLVDAGERRRRETFPVNTPGLKRRRLFGGEIIRAPRVFPPRATETRSTEGDFFSVALVVTGSGRFAR